MNKDLKYRYVGIIVLTLLATQFLGSDFCQDVLSIPLKVDYQSDVIEIEVDFDKAQNSDGDQDGEMDGDLDDEFEIPEGEDEFAFEDMEEPEINPEGYLISAQRETINLADSSKGISGLMDYKGNVLGVFIRVVSYNILENTVPARIPPLDIYLSPLYQPEEKDEEEQTESSSIADSGEGEVDSEDGEQAFDWSTALSNEEYLDWDLPEFGFGENQLVKLGQTEQILCMVTPDNDDPDPYCKVPSGFPSTEKRIIRQVANLDEISDTIISNFKFEVVILPTEKIVLDEGIWDSVDKTKDWKLKLQLHFVVVITAKVD